MRYCGYRKMQAMLLTRSIKTTSPVGIMGLHVRPGFAGVTIGTLGNTGAERKSIPALSDSLSWDSLAEKLPNWISKYSIKGIIVGHLRLSPTAPHYLKEQHDLVEKLSKVKGIKDGMLYTFNEY